MLLGGLWCSNAAPAGEITTYFGDREYGLFGKFSAA